MAVGSSQQKRKCNTLSLFVLPYLIDPHLHVHKLKNNQHKYKNMTEYHRSLHLTSALGDITLSSSHFEGVVKDRASSQGLNVESKWSRLCEECK